jgi:hypothetical protein
MVQHAALAQARLRRHGVDGQRARAAPAQDRARRVENHFGISDNSDLVWHAGWRVQGRGSGAIMSQKTRSRRDDRAEVILDAAGAVLRRGGARARSASQAAMPVRSSSSLRPTRARISASFEA